MNTRSAFQPKTAQGLNSGLVAYYRMDGNGNDSIGSRNLSTNGTVNFNTGKIGSSADFGDTDSHGNCLHYTIDGLGIDQRTNWTMSLWLKINTAPTGDRRFVQWESTTGASRELSFRYGDYSGTKSIRCSLSNGADPIQYDTTLSIGTWYHLVFTCDSSGNVSFYFNGTSVDTGTMGTNTGGNFLHIGSANTHVIGSACDVDELGFWNRTLSASEVSDLYLSGDGRQLPNQMFSTKAYYPLNGNSTDFSGNGNHGTDTAITYPQGRFGQGAKFNGTSSKITTTFFQDPDTYNSGMTCSIWTYVTTNQNGKMFFYFAENGAWGGIYAQMQNGKYEVRFGSGTVGFFLDSLVATKLGRWVHICMTHDTSNNIVYIDGVRANSQASQTLANTSSTLHLGFNTIDYTNCLLDEFIIESRAWTAKEVETYYRKSMQNYKRRTLFSIISNYFGNFFNYFQ